MKNIHTIFILSSCGFIFSGYYALTKFFTDTCAFGETCPYFLGYPACYFGFGMFTVLWGASVYVLAKGTVTDVLTNVFTVVSLVGIAFAGYYTLSELPLLFTQGLGAYFFGLPTCAIGLLFYAGIFSLSVKK